MKAPVQRLWRFLKFYLRATTIYGLHAPFAYEFAHNIIEQKGRVPREEEIENLRQNLQTDNRIIQVTDFGAGSSYQQTNQRRIKDIARHSATPKMVSGWLSRSIQYYKCHSILEIGTSLGLGSLYLAASTSGTLTSLEGCPETARIARENIQKLGIENIEIKTGQFSKILPALLSHTSFKPDFIYFDGDHREESVLRQFELSLGQVGKQAVLVFDDIYWSEGMMSAWKQICARPEVRLSIDLFFSGYIFLDPQIITKQHYRLVRKSWKPWQVGIRLLHPKI
ncbi:MAG: class I SAM-dependent methyltransferase [Saprospiraceae bacterium]|nr:class I SAM-dependent methyltransferase [Saprospiraceae bacterium]